MPVRSDPSPRRGRHLAAAILSGVLLAVGVATPAGAVTVEQKISLLSAWTQPSAASYNAWNAARVNRAPWAEYQLDWSTDYCSVSPDQPLGFDFRMACWRHDFGYRNYKVVGQFAANKPRLDSAFHADMRAKCATYSVVVRPACISVAWTYYQAVAAFGGLAVSPAQLEPARRLKAEAERAAAGAAA